VVVRRPSSAETGSAWRYFILRDLADGTRTAEELADLLDCYASTVLSDVRRLRQQGAPVSLRPAPRRR